MPRVYRERGPARRRPRQVIAAALAIALIAAVIFLTRLAGLVVAPPGDPRIEGWMTPRYVARRFEVAPDLVARTLGVTPGSARHKTIRAIARERGVAPGALAAELTDAIGAVREGRQ